MSSSAPVVHLEDYASRRAASRRGAGERHAGAYPSAGPDAATASTASATGPTEPNVPAPNVPAPTVPGRTRPTVPPLRRRGPRPRLVRACGREQGVRREADVELTRRGWAAIAIVAVMLVAFGLFGANAWSPDGAADTQTPGGSGSSATMTVTVQPGQTLWEIAGRVAPDGDVRATVDRISELNGLTSAGDVQAGQRLVVPAVPRR